MACSYVFDRLFPLLICVGSVLFSKCLADDSTDHVLLENVAGNTSGQYYIYKGTVLPEMYGAIADSIENFEVRDDDVYVCTFPRSGTTWMQEMVWNIVHDLDFEGARVKQTQRMPFLGFNKEAVGINSSDPASNDRLREFVKNLSDLSSPRVIKTHLPFQLLPRQLREGEKKSKIVYVSRNPKDACISYYHFHKLIGEYSGTLEDFCKAFMKDGFLYTPYWGHVNEFYERKDDENILFVKFEDMKSDLRSVIKRVAGFLGKQLTYQQIKDLEEHLSFTSMQKNPAVNREEEMGSRCKGNSCNEKFLRSGEVDQWKTAMSKELIKQFDDWIQANSKE